MTTQNELSELDDMPECDAAWFAKAKLKTRRLVGKRAEIYVEPSLYLGQIVRQVGPYVWVKTLLKFRPNPCEFIVRTTYIVSLEE